jgi:hypothetical protein
VKYCKKSDIIEAITFDELVNHGRLTGCRLHGGMPWHFEFKRKPISHENDSCYIIPTRNGTAHLNRGDMLICDNAGELYPCKRDDFEAAYTAIEELAVRSEEIGWCIERYVNSELRYWTGISLNPESFLPDHAAAIRFARAQDATDVLSLCLQGNGRVAQHIWCGLPHSTKGAE